MDIKWYVPSIGTPMVTLARYGITLNKAAAEEMQNPAYIRFGYAKNEKMIVIQPLENEQPEAIEFIEKMRKDYVRINRKDLVRFITRYFNLNLEKAIRIPAYWSDDFSALVVDLNQAEVDDGDEDESK